MDDTKTLGFRESSDHIKSLCKIHSKCSEIWKVHSSALHPEPPSAPCITDLFFVVSSYPASNE